MKIRQWEIWKSKPPGFEQAHWFVILSGQERLDSNRSTVNALACFTLRGAQKPVDVRLNGADGFDHATVCQCDYVFSLDKNNLADPLGNVSWNASSRSKASSRKFSGFDDRKKL